MAARWLSDDKTVLEHEYSMAGVLYLSNAVGGLSGVSVLRKLLLCFALRLPDRLCPTMKN
jgi:hypothetical protein